MDQVAITLHSLFSHVDLTLSDYATALLLVGIQHRLTKEELLSVNRHRPGGREWGDIEAGAPRNSTAVEEDEKSCFTSQKAMEAGPSASPPLSSPAGVDIEVLRDAVHYFKHACAVFGWPMHVWMTMKEPTR